MRAEPGTEADWNELDWMGFDLFGVLSFVLFSAEEAPSAALSFLPKTPLNCGCGQHTFLSSTNCFFPEKVRLGPALRTSCTDFFLFCSLHSPERFFSVLFVGTCVEQRG